MVHNLLLTVQTPWHHLAPQPLLHREGPSAVPKGGGQCLIFLFLTLFLSCLGISRGATLQKSNSETSPPKPFWLFSTRRAIAEMVFLA